MSQSSAGRHDPNQSRTILPPDSLSSTASLHAGNTPTWSNIQQSGSTDPSRTLDPTSNPADSNLPQLGEYELLGALARGGMGIVYKARQRKLDRVVALKMIRAGELADEEQVRRFYSEAQAAAQLDHAGIVPVYEVGEANGQHFYSMAFVAGQSLNDAVKSKGPLSGSLAATLLKQVAEAVHYAHSKGVIHRDIKPGNILVDEAWHPRVTDFGLAKQLQSSHDLTVSGQVLGTPSYMPPEQAAGKVDEIGPAADVYSLGATLYFLLTGRPPFQASSLSEILRQVADDEPVPPRRLSPDIPHDLETIALKCLHKEPSNRYADCAALAADLDRYLRNEPILAHPVSAWERAAKWCRRNPGVSFFGGATALLILTIATVAPWVAMSMSNKNQQLSIEITKTKDAKKQSDENLQRFQDADAARQQRLAEALVSNARAKIAAGLPGQRLESLELLKQATEITGSTTEIVDVAASALCLPDVKLGAHIVDSPGQITALADHPPSQRYALLCSDGSIYLSSGENQKPRLIAARASDHTGMTTPAIHFSSDGKFLRVTTEFESLIVDLATEQRLSHWYRPQGDIVLERRWSVQADYNKLALLGSDGRQPVGRWVLPYELTGMTCHPSLPMAFVTCRFPNEKSTRGINRHFLLDFDNGTLDPILTKEATPFYHWGAGQLALGHSKVFGLPIPLFDLATGESQTIPLSTLHSPEGAAFGSNDNLISLRGASGVSLVLTSDGHQLISHALPLVQTNPGEIGGSFVARHQDGLHRLEVYPGYEYRRIPVPKMAASYSTGGRIFLSPDETVAVFDQLPDYYYLLLDGNSRIVRSPSLRNVVGWSEQNEIIAVDSRGLHFCQIELGADRNGLRTITEVWKEHWPYEIDADRSQPGTQRHTGHVIAVPDAKSITSKVGEVRTRTAKSHPVISNLGPPLKFNRDGSYAAGRLRLADDVFALVSATDEQLKPILQFRGPCDYEFSASGKFFTRHDRNSSRCSILRLADRQVVFDVESPANCAISADDRLLAVSSSLGTLDIYHQSPWQRLVRLTLPNQARLRPQFITKRGQVILFNETGGTIDILDLAALGQSLREQTLQTHWPEFSGSRYDPELRPLAVRSSLQSRPITPLDGAYLPNYGRYKVDRPTWVFRWHPVAGASEYEIIIKQGDREELKEQTSGTELRYRLPRAYEESERSDWTWSVRPLVDKGILSTQKFTVMRPYAPPVPAETRMNVANLKRLTKDPAVGDVLQFAYDIRNPTDDLTRIPLNSFVKHFVERLGDDPNIAALKTELLEGRYSVGGRKLPSLTLTPGQSYSTGHEFATADFPVGRYRFHCVLESPGKEPVTATLEFELTEAPPDRPKLKAARPQKTSAGSLQVANLRSEPAK